MSIQNLSHCFTDCLKNPKRYSRPMQFLLVAHDGEDPDALARRLAVREQHIAYSNEAIKRGEQLIGAAILSDTGTMRGSMMVVDFPSRVELDQWLEKEPYVLGGVWKTITVYPCKVGPSFEHLFKPNS
jgi:uncharacterized protein YciI